MVAQMAAKSAVKIPVLVVMNSACDANPANNPRKRAIAFHVLGSFSLSKMNCIVFAGFPAVLLVKP